MSGRFWLGFAAYVAVTVPLGYVWHLSLFGSLYHDLGAFREDITYSVGIAATAIQAGFVSWLYPRIFDPSAPNWLTNGIVFGFVVGLFAWAYAALGVAAKNVVVSRSGFIELETLYVAIQYGLAGPLVALARRTPAKAAAKPAAPPQKKKRR